MITEKQKQETIKEIEVFLDKYYPGLKDNQFAVASIKLALEFLEKKISWNTMDTLPEEDGDYLVLTDMYQDKPLKPLISTYISSIKRFSMDTGNLTHWKKIDLPSQEIIASEEAHFTEEEFEKKKKYLLPKVLRNTNK